MINTGSTSPDCDGHSCGCGSKLNKRGYAGFGPCFHLPGFHFATGFLSHSHVPRTCAAAGSAGCRARGGHDRSEPPISDVSFPLNTGNQSNIFRNSLRISLFLSLTFRSSSGVVAFGFAVCMGPQISLTGYCSPSHWVSSRLYG